MKKHFLYVENIDHFLVVICLCFLDIIVITWNEPLGQIPTLF